LIVAVNINRERGWTVESYVRRRTEQGRPWYISLLLTMQNPWRLVRHRHLKLFHLNCVPCGMGNLVCNLYECNGRKWGCQGAKRRFKSKCSDGFG